MERLTAVAESAPTVTAPHVTTKTGSKALSALRRLRCQALYDPYNLSLLILLLIRGLQPRIPVLYEKTTYPVSAPPAPPPLAPPSPPLSPLPPNFALSSTFDIQTEPSDGSFQDIAPSSSGGEKEKADTGDGCSGDEHIEDGHSGDEHSGDGHSGDGHKEGREECDEHRTAMGLRDSSKRTAGIAGLNKGGKGGDRLGKVQYTGQSASPNTVYRI